VLLTAQSDAQWESLAKLIGKEDIAAEHWDFQMRNIKRRDDVERWISDWVKTKTFDEAIKELHAIRIPATAVVSKAELATHPQVLARDLLLDIEDPDVGTVSGVVAPAPRLMETPGGIDESKIPTELGQHTDEILSDLLGYDKEKLSGLREAGVI
jgi:crotonobetainyl-CoA:carnitine CoA-transferase CaiB-like acyl-CoA transferase